MQSEQSGAAEMMEAEPAGEVNLKICVDRLADGTFSVYVDSGAEVDGEAHQTAEDLEGALQIVMDLVEQHPDDQSPQAQFSAGFKGENREPY
jgi:hypothetical protein